jgi:hypothetical protein
MQGIAFPDEEKTVLARGDECAPIWRQGRGVDPARPSERFRQLAISTLGIAQPYIWPVVVCWLPAEKKATSDFLDFSDFACYVLKLGYCH